jgi:hypothetical protein
MVREVCSRIAFRSFDAMQGRHMIDGVVIMLAAQSNRVMKSARRIGSGCRRRTGI